MIRRDGNRTELVDPTSWRLNVFGSGLDDPDGASFSLRDLRCMPSESRAAFMECAGNGRSFFATQQGTGILPDASRKVYILHWVKRGSDWKVADLQDFTAGSEPAN